MNRAVYLVALASVVVVTSLACAGGSPPTPPPDSVEDGDSASDAPAVRAEPPDDGSTRTAEELLDEALEGVEYSPRDPDWVTQGTVPRAGSYPMATALHDATGLDHHKLSLLQLKRGFHGMIRWCADVPTDTRAYDRVQRVCDAVTLYSLPSRASDILPRYGSTPDAWSALYIEGLEYRSFFHDDADHDAARARLIDATGMRESDLDVIYAASSSQGLEAIIKGWPGLENRDDLLALLE